ncbi:Retrovirus-related Pol polyprotein from transposon 17.6, partial [Mucuna pruriens]
MVMPFGLTNTPSTFMRLMNHILKSLIGKCVVVYFDDILIYSTCLNDHLLHVRSVLEILRKETLFANLEKLLRNSDDILPKESMIHGDHEALKHLRGQGKLNKRHAKWVEFLEQFPYIIKHKQGELNVVANASSRRHALIGMLETKMFGLDCIMELYEKVIDFSRKLCMSANSIRQLLVKKAHEGGLMGHFGELKTYEVLSEHFFWPRMRKDVHHMCNKCLVCKLAKSKVSPHGLYTPLPIPTTPWTNISMDFVLGFLDLKEIETPSSWVNFGDLFGVGLELSYFTQLLGIPKKMDRQSLHMEKKGEHYARSASRGRKEVLFKEEDLVWVHWRKDRFPHLRKSKLLPREDNPFKILRKINNNAYQLDMPPNFKGSTTFNVIDLTPFDTRVEESNLRVNSLQEGEDNAYTKRENPTPEGPITWSRLRKIQEEVQH